MRFALATAGVLAALAFVPSIAAGPLPAVVSAGPAYSFLPDSVTIDVGESVTWIATGARHTVTAEDGSFDSGILVPGVPFTVGFAEPGTFGYFCSSHSTLGMVGVVNVEA